MEDAGDNTDMAEQKEPKKRKRESRKEESGEKERRVSPWTTYMSSLKKDFEDFIEAIVPKDKEKALSYVKQVKDTSLENFLFQFMDYIAPVYNSCCKNIALNRMLGKCAMARSDISTENFDKFESFIKLFCSESQKLKNKDQNL